MSNKSQKPVAVAIDGPSASGKSTVARRVAQALRFLYVDSGSFYRGLTWKVLHEEVPPSDPATVRECIRRLAWRTILRDGAVFFTIDGHDPSTALRSSAITAAASDVAAIPEVRSFVVERLRAALKYGSLVMEGRDIGTVVFADTPYKFYLDADPAERARRRHLEIGQVEGGNGIEEVSEALKQRDRKDASRAADPLRIAPGAEVIDSTALNIEETARRILNSLRDRGIGP